MDPEVSLAIGPNVSDDSENLDDYFADRGLEYVEIHPENAVFESNGTSNSESTFTSLLYAILLAHASCSISRITESNRRIEYHNVAINGAPTVLDRKASRSF